MRKPPCDQCTTDCRDGPCFIGDPTVDRDCDECEAALDAWSYSIYL